MEDLPTLTTAVARQGFAGLVARVAFYNDRIVLTRHGRTMAAMVRVKDLWRLLELEAEHERAAYQGPQLSVGEAVAARLQAELGLRSPEGAERAAA